jgi:hypothetical protein
MSSIQSVTYPFQATTQSAGLSHGMLTTQATLPPVFAAIEATSAVFSIGQTSMQSQAQAQAQLQTFAPMLPPQPVGKPGNTSASAVYAQLSGAQPQALPQFGGGYAQATSYPVPYQAPQSSLETPGLMMQPPTPGRQEAGPPASITPIIHPGNEPRQDQELVAVVVTICDGGSYDVLFSSVPQLAGDGKRVAVYSANPRSLAHILSELTGQRAQGERSSEFHRNLRHLIRDMSAVQPDSVVFNWECCAGCSGETFPNSEVVMTLAKRLIDRGHMVMFSDFSLKALIRQWDEDRLGPNPFVKVGEFSTCFKLRFDPAALSDCPSAQLQKLGELASDGNAELHAMGGTIAFSVLWQKADCSAYTCQVLTVMTEMEGRPVDVRAGQGCEVGAHRGNAGHVLLTYPSGGRLVASAGHWMELSKFDVSETNLIAAAQQYGAAYVSQVQTSLKSCTNDAQRRETMQSMSSQMVQQAVPCSYSMNSR